MKTMLIVFLMGFAAAMGFAADLTRPNIVLMMADDQGWGETGYNGHPQVKTPVLDQMAASGLRLDRFYSAGCVCSPTRTGVLTGRNPTRSGVFAPNYTTRPEEITIARALKNAGYRTGHFGKWHVGAVKAASPTNPGKMGFDEYLSHDNFFEIDPPLSRNGAPPEIHKGESSMIVVDAGIEFVKKIKGEGKPFFVILWFGSPHAPYSGMPEDLGLYKNVPKEEMRNRFAEITAMDRAIGKFRAMLKDEGLAENTLVWYESDNGIPVASEEDSFNGGWRGRKGSIYEGGLRVPAIIEWPAAIKENRRSSIPCVSTDIFPTLLDLTKTQSPDPQRPIDGVSLRGLIEGTMKERPRPIGFWKYNGAAEKNNGRWMDEELTRGTTPTTRNPAIDFINYKHPVAMTGDFVGEAAWTDNQYKLFTSAKGAGGKAKGKKAAGTIELYDLLADPKEEKNIAAEHPDVVKKMLGELHEWQASVERSLSGADYH